MSSELPLAPAPIYFECMRSTAAVVGVCLTVALACGSPSPPAAPPPPALKPPPPPYVRLDAPQISKTGELSRYLTEARELEQRGALDSAANRLERAYILTGDPRYLWRASLLYEEAWSFESANFVLEPLAALPAFAGRLAERAAALKSAEAAAIYDSGLNVDRTALVTAAHTELQKGERVQALHHLSEAAAAYPNSAVLRAEARLLWQLGKHRRAQIQWARARSLAAPLTRQLGLRALPQLAAPASKFTFVRTPTFASLGEPEGRKTTGISYAAADGRVYTFDPARGFTTESDDDIHAKLKVEARRKAGAWRGAPVTRELSGAGSLAGFSLRDDFLSARHRPVAVALSRDSERAALFDTSGLLWTFSPSAAEDQRIQVDWSGPVTHRRTRSRTGRGRPRKLPMIHVQRAKQELLYLSAHPKLGLAWTVVKAGRVIELGLRGVVRRSWQAHEQAVHELVASRDGQLLATAAGREIKVWKLRTLRPLYRTTLDQPARFMDFDSSGENIEVIAGSEAVTLAWRENTRSAPRQVGEVVNHRLSGDGRYAASIVQDSRVIEVQDHQAIRELKITSGQVEQLRTAFSDDGRQLAVVGTELWLFQIAPWRERKLADLTASALSFSPSGRYLAALSPANGVLVFDASGQRIAQIPVDSNNAAHLRMLADDRLVVGDGKQLFFYDVGSGKLAGREPGNHYHELKAGVLRSVDKRVLFEPSGDLPPERHVGDVLGVSRAGTRFVVADHETRSLTFRDVESGEQLRLERQLVPDQMALSDDGQHLLALTADSEHPLQVLDVSAERWRPVMSDGHRGLSSVNDLHFHNGIALASGSGGLLAFGVSGSDEERGSASLHQLASGGWFAMAEREQAATDGAPGAINWTFTQGKGGHPGFVWESYRETGAFGRFLNARPVRVVRPLSRHLENGARTGEFFRLRTWNFRYGSDR